MLKFQIKFQIFGTLNVVSAIFCFFLPETKDISLEQMDVLFGVIDEDTRRHDIEIAGRTRKVGEANVEPLEQGSKSSV